MKREIVGKKLSAFFRSLAMDQIVDSLMVSNLQSHLFVVKAWSQTWFVIFPIQAILCCVSRASIAFLVIILFPKSHLEDTSTEVLRIPN